MRTCEERVCLIRRRAAEIKKADRKKKQRIVDAGCLVACLLLVTGIGTFLPELLGGASYVSMIHTSGAASLVVSNASLVYVMMGLMCFLLGMCVTVLLYRVRHKNNHKHYEDMKDEL